LQNLWKHCKPAWQLLKNEGLMLAFLAKPEVLQLAHLVSPREHGESKEHNTRGNCKTSWKCCAPEWQFLKNARLAPAFPAKQEVLQLALPR